MLQANAFLNKYFLNAPLERAKPLIALISKGNRFHNLGALETPRACLQMKVYADGYTLCGKIFSRVSPVFPLFSNSARASSVVFPFIRASGWARKLAKRI